MGGGAPRREHSRLRPAAVLLVVCGLCAVTMGFMLSPTARSASTADDFVRGSADAKADTIAAGIVAGGATIGVTWGRVMAQYQESTGLAESRALDIGILKALLGTTCDGTPPSLDPATIPPGTRVDARQPGAEASHLSQVSGPGAKDTGASVGTEDARATNQPWSWAATETVDTNLLLVGLKGGRAEATTEIVDGTRRAKAVVTGSALTVFGGLIVFRDPRWEAEATSGAETATTGSFTFSGATLFGIERSAADAEGGFETFAADVARSMSALGVHLDYPKVRVDGKRVKVTPMTFGITDPPAGAANLAPALAQAQPLREVLTDYLLKVDCKNSTTITVVDILLSILAGSGSVNLSAGGVDVSTDDTVYENPFAGGGITLGASAAPKPATVTPAKPAGATTAAVAAPQAAPGESEPALAEPALEEASNRKFLDGSTGGVALAVGAGALAGAAALAAGDFVTMRRGRRRIADP